MVSVEIPNMPKVEIDEAEITAWIEKRLDNAREIFARQMSRKRGGGRKYRRGRKFHYASAPGEYPVTDGGRLVTSVQSEMISAREGRLTSDLKYADYLTTGTEYMEPRRMLADAIKEALDDQPEADKLAKAAHVK